MITHPGASPVEVRQSPEHGRGLFAMSPIARGKEIGVFPLLILSEDDTATVGKTLLHHYVFYIDETDDGRMRAAVAFGVISMCNHSVDANAAFEVDAAAQAVTLKASRNIAQDEEVFIDYEEFADEII